MKTISRFFVFVLFFFIAAPAFAMTARGGQAVYIPKDEVVNGTLFAGGNSVTIDGTVHGDVFCGSQTVVITGTVDGDVICGAQTIRISGSVAGSIRAGAQTIDISGPVGRNVTVVAQTLTIDQAGDVAGEILAAVQHASIDSRIGGDITIADESLVFGDHAVIGGSVHYESKMAATIAPSATIAGTLTQTVPKTTEKTSVTEVKKVVRGGSLAGKIIFYFILAALVTLIAPKRTKRILDLMKTSAGRMMLKGFIVIIVVPIIILTIALTLIGIPFAILLGLVFALTLATAEVFTAIYAGRYILNRFNAGRPDRMLTDIVVGVPVACLVFAIPVLGGIASFFGVIWGLGALMESRIATEKVK
jgi:hypothetical protein